MSKYFTLGSVAMLYFSVGHYVMFVVSLYGLFYSLIQLFDDLDRSDRS